MRPAVRICLLVAGTVGYLALLGLSFWAGMLHQRNSDQQIHDQYYPAQASGYTGGGAGTVRDPLVAAALTLGNPPGSSTAAAPGTTPQAASPVQGTIAGKLTASSGTSLTIQTNQGATQTLATNRSTLFYLRAPSSIAALEIVQRVALTTILNGSQTPAAASVVIAP